MIAIGCDHAAVEFKKSIIEHLQARGWKVQDFETHTSEEVDYT